MTSFARDPLWLLWNEGNFDTDLLYNSCLNSLQAKKWCSSLSSLHIDEELASLMPPKNWFRPFSPSSMQLSKLSWQSSSSTHANYQLPEETISPDPHQPSFNETFLFPFAVFKLFDFFFFNQCSMTFFSHSWRESIISALALENSTNKLS